MLFGGEGGTAGSCAPEPRRVDPQRGASGALDRRGGLWSGPSLTRRCKRRKAIRCFPVASIRVQAGSFSYVSITPFSRLSLAVIRSSTAPTVCDRIIALTKERLSRILAEAPPATA